MKIISLSGLVLSVVFIAFGLYLHFVVAPDAYAAESAANTKAKMMNYSDEYYQSTEHVQMFEKMEMKTDYGIYCMMGSILPFLLCLVAGIKKQKIAWIGVVLSLAAFFIGAAYGSHMFS